MVMLHDLQFGFIVDELNKLDGNSSLKDLKNVMINLGFTWYPYSENNKIKGEGVYVFRYDNSKSFEIDWGIHAERGIPNMNRTGKESEVFLYVGKEHSSIFNRIKNSHYEYKKRDGTIKSFSNSGLRLKKFRKIKKYKIKCNLFVLETNENVGLKKSYINFIERMLHDRLKPKVGSSK